MNGLKKCPFCGSEWVQIAYRNNPFDEQHVYGGYQGECCDCYCSTRRCKTEEQALEWWNMRVGETE